MERDEISLKKKKSKREEREEGKKPGKRGREVEGRAGKGRGERVDSLVRINPCCLESIPHQQIL